MSKELVKQEGKPLMPTTSIELSEIYSPANCMRQLSRYKTTALAMNSDTPSISSLARTMGTKSIEAYIKLWILDLDVSLELKKSLKPHQIDQMAFRIVDQFRSLNIADINLIFTNAKFGEYGELYDRLTTATVLKWFKDYFDQRCDVASEQSRRDHLQYKSAFSDVPRSSESNSNMRDEMAKAKKQYEKHISIEEAKERVGKVKKAIIDGKTS